MGRTGHVARKRRRGMHIGFRRESQKDRDHQKPYTSIAVMIIKTDIREIRWGVMDWIDSIQEEDQRRAFTYMVMNLLVP
jgi:hypothetical protein